MTFEDVLRQVQEVLQQEGRISYRALKRRFDLDDEYLEDLKAELIDAKQLAADEEGKVLIWIGATTHPAGPQSQTQTENTPQAAKAAPRDWAQDQQSLLPLRSTRQRVPEAERRQLTVMFCDVIGSTALSEQLDPEELREVMRAYQHTCVDVIAHFEGHVAKYLGDGLLVYFGYPTAHEDDAVRAVRAGLGIVAALQALALPPHVHLAQPLQVRLGIHTGVVVAGEMGSGAYREELAIVGETPNLAARLQEQAPPNSVVISAMTHHLVAGLFDCEALGPRPLKGLTTPVAVYRVIGETEAQSRFEAAVHTGLTPLVGREHEVGLLQERWERAKQGTGQVVLLSGEAGIGKSHLVQAFKERVMAEGATRIEFRCSPYHQNSAFYLLITHLHRLLQFAPHEAPQARLAKLAQLLARYRFPQTDTLPLLAALLSLPQPEGTPPLALSPQKQRQKTQEILVTWLVKEAEQQAVCCAWEDVHWIDPSSLEVLTLLLQQVPTTRLLALLTFRPEFIPPWGTRSHISQLTLSRLGRVQVEEMAQKVTGGKALPAEVLQQIVSKTDGVPLFVEELTKMVIESGLLREADDHYELNGPLLPLAIPSTLQDSLMARLDRVSTVREIAQLGATIGREFSYELIRAVSPWDDATLEQGLHQLVDAELVYRRGLASQAHYIFKHALVQDTAYQSLLKSRRQQLHHQIAQALAQQFPETRPELVAYHYTEAGLSEQAISYWLQAGQQAIQSSANLEAIRHLTKGLELVKTLPETPEHLRQELNLQIALGPALIATKGYVALEVERAYTRALELCQQLEDDPQRFPVLYGLWAFYLVRADLHTSCELGEQLLSLAKHPQDSVLLIEAHWALGCSFFWLGELTLAREHLEQSLALYEPREHGSLTFRYGQDPAVSCLCYLAFALWHLGYPDQALQRSHEAIALAQKLSQSYNLAFALGLTAMLHQLRWEVQLTQEQAQTARILSTEQGFPFWEAVGRLMQGWAFTETGQVAEGMAKLHQGVSAYQSTGSKIGRPWHLALLSAASGQAGHPEEGLSLLAEACTLARTAGGCNYEAELYRLKGQLTLQHEARGWGLETENQRLETGDWRLAPSPQASSLQPPVSSGVAQEAEGYFLKAIDIARRQHAKAWELRAATSLAELWRQQGKHAAAHQLLAEIYGWFTEGFATKDLQEARALLDELS